MPRTALATAIAASLLLSLPSSAVPPRLVVVLVYDQMRGDFLWRWEHLLSGGFARLLQQGRVYRHCFIEHAATVTCAGHATLVTGTAPEEHGIVGNDLLPRCCQPRTVKCTEDLQGRTSAQWLLRPSLGHALRQRFPGARIAALSHKRTAALMMGNTAADYVLWADPQHGGLTAAPGAPSPAWLSEWNLRHHPRRWLGQCWQPTLPDSLAPADAVPWELPFPGGTTAFPHCLNSDSTLWAAFLLSPFSVEWLFDAAVELLRTEGLGQDSVPDLLLLSVSTTDFVGHQFGPDSREVVELYLACDRILGDFLAYLDRTVGAGNYLVVLTSDHGVAPVPEMLARSGPGAYPGLDAGRIDPAELRQFLESALQRAFGRSASREWFLLRTPFVVLDRQRIAAAGASWQAVRDSLARWLAQYPGIGIVQSPEALRASENPSPLERLLRRSLHPEHAAADLLFLPKPYWIVGTDAAATHGTPYDYDRHIPLLLFGWGITPAVRDEPVSAEDIAPTLAALLGLSLPTAQGRVLPISP